MKKPRTEKLRKSDEEIQNISQWRKSFLLNRQREQRQRRKEQENETNKEVFERKLKSAPDSTSPYTLRTKGYYRFAKEFPSKIDIDGGMRENTPEKELNKKRRRIILAAVFAVVFCAAFTGTKVAINISNTEIPTEAPMQSEEQDNDIRAYRFTSDELSAGDTAVMEKILTENGCNTALFEFKDEYGYVYFDVGSFQGASADRRIDNAGETLSALKADGYLTAAYISCFKDTVAATSDLTFAVRNNTAEGSAWFDNSSSAWLNSFSDSAVSYLLNLISKASEYGFTCIFLDNICFPSVSSSGTAFFEGETASRYSRNSLLNAFINSAVRRGGNSEVIPLLLTEGILTDENDSSGIYGGLMLSSDAASLCADLRLSRQGKNITIGSDSFSSAWEMPYVFVLAAAEAVNTEAKELAAEKPVKMYACIENGETLKSQLNALGFAGINNYVIW